jgi:hypothetical protein
LLRETFSGRRTAAIAVAAGRGSTAVRSAPCFRALACVVTCEGASVLDERELVASAESTFGTIGVQAARTRLRVDPRADRFAGRQHLVDSAVRTRMSVDARAVDRARAERWRASATRGISQAQGLSSGAGSHASRVLIPLEKVAATPRVDRRPDRTARGAAPAYGEELRGAALH